MYAAELVKAIQSMHEHGIMHRDLKPENVLFDQNLHLKIVSLISKITPACRLTSEMQKNLILITILAFLNQMQTTRKLSDRQGNSHLQGQTIVLGSRSWAHHSTSHPKCLQIAWQYQPQICGRLDASYTECTRGSTHLLLRAMQVSTRRY